MGGNVFFIQLRSGQNGRAFKMVKFRSMNEKKNQEGELLEDFERITWLGAILRKSSIDELPELWNVLLGHMSLVGPRPLLLEYNDLYSTEQYRRLEVKPGITGWAQINGRNSLTWEQRLKLDVWYVDNRSFWLDLKIIIWTFGKVLSHDGISAEGKATMTKFRGSEKK